MGGSGLFCEACGARCLPGASCDKCGVVNVPSSSSTAAPAASSDASSRRAFRRHEREAARAAVALVARGVLVDIADGWRMLGESPAMRAAAELELERRYPCADCGARAGQTCRPEYGCRPRDRRPADHAGGRDSTAGGVPAGVLS